MLFPMLRHLQAILLLLLSEEASAQALLPPAVLKLKQTYEQSMEKAAAPIRERYVDNLTKLQDQLTKSSKPEAALAVKAEIRLVLVQPMLGRWNDAAGDGILELRKGGVTTHSNGTTGSWEIRDNLLCIDWANGWKHEFPIVKVGPLLSGTLINPSGDRNTFLESRPHDK
ncbi:MAG: hypothetical protein EOP84_01590 [Verrucomicrobiaceae bacterium]|nr:MAG: hypothetical protein EOP84_01590 [Verrucomicrobiaceae bacterium]